MPQLLFEMEGRQNYKSLNLMKLLVGINDFCFFIFFLWIGFALSKVFSEGIISFGVGKCN